METSCSAVVDQTLCYTLLLTSCLSLPLRARKTSQRQWSFLSTTTPIFKRWRTNTSSLWLVSQSANALQVYKQSKVFSWVVTVEYIQCGRDLWIKELVTLRILCCSQGCLFSEVLFRVGFRNCSWVTASFPLHLITVVAVLALHLAAIS